jgi:ribonuclease J
MKLIIHRGTKEIGGSCVELQSEKTRIIIDLGMPLVNGQNEPFDSRLLKDKSIPELIASHLLPDIKGIYAGEEKSIDAILISHPHQDHYGLLRYINPEIPVYLSRGALALIQASDIFIPIKANLRNVITFKMWEPFIIGDLGITPQLVDHSAFDAAAFLIECEGKKIFYSGDFRGHGRKHILLDNILKYPKEDIDYLLLEGSMLGRGEGFYTSEQAVEDKMVTMFKDKQNMAFVFCSSQNIDRLVSVYRAAIRSGQITVIDLYNAYILDSLKDISNKLPQYSRPDIRVFYFWGHRKMLRDNGLGDFVDKCLSARIYKEELSRDKKSVVMITKYNPAFMKLLGYLGDINGALGIYSMWEGYLEKNDFRKSLQRQGIEFKTIHTSGHAPERDLKRLVEAFKPKCIVPIHTFHPEKYQSLFPNANVHQLNDGEELIL